MGTFAVTAPYMLTVDDNDSVLRDQTLVVKDGRIAAIVHNEEFCNSEWKDCEVLKFGENVVLLPGLINAHTHLGMTTFRGHYEGLDLMPWLKKVWHMENHFMSDRWVEISTECGIAHGTLAGTTTFADHYWKQGVAIEVAKRAGVRYFSGELILDRGDKEENNVSIERASKQLGSRHVDPRALIKSYATLHGTYTSDAALQDRLAAIIKRYDSILHVHFHETKGEDELSWDKCGARPIDRMEGLGLLGPNFLGAHGIWFSDEDVELLGKRGVNIVSCPRSNAKIASGIAPVRDLVRAGVNVCLGTDSAQTNNDLDILSEMRTAVLLNRVKTMSASSMADSEFIRMATINGARALGIDGVTGSLEVGKEADFIAVDLSMEGAYFHVSDPVETLLYTSHPKVTDVWCAGRHLVRNKEILTIKRNEDDIRNLANEIHAFVKSNPVDLPTNKM